jgi:opacity protein-like surface antigen
MISDSRNYPKKAAPDASLRLNRQWRICVLGLAAFILTGKPTFSQEDGGTNSQPPVTHEGKKNRIIFYDDQPAPTASPASTSPTPVPESSAAPAPTAAPLAVTSQPAAASVPSGDPTALPVAAASTPTPPPTSAPAPAPASTPEQPVAAASASEAPSASLNPVQPQPTEVPKQTVAAATPAPSVAPLQNASASSSNASPVPASSTASTSVSKPAPPQQAEVKAEPSQPAPAASVAQQAPMPVASAPVSNNTPAASVAAASAPVGAAAVTNKTMAGTAPAANPAPNPGPVHDNTPPPPSQSVTINLINKLVQRGILTKEDAASMIAQAEAEAQTAREQSQADMFAIAQVTAARAASDQAVAAANAAPPPDEGVRVTYIPEPVKTQIKEEVKLELFDEAKTSRDFKGPQIYLPEWVSRVRPFADLRFRYEGDYYPSGNDNTGAFPNFNAINTGAPFDVSGNQFAPQYNVDQNRNRFRFRARFGAELDLNENITMGLRIATGETNSPVTSNQTLGVANQGQGGQFSRYAIWLDRAFLKYQMGDEPNKNLTVFVGRFDNPFFSTPLIFWDDLGFDGIALRARYEVTEGVTPFFTAGAFPVFNTDLNFSSNQPAKFQSYDKYLYAAQLGVDWQIADKWKAKVAASYYYFYNIEGQLSSPFTPQNASDAGDTDNSRPSFAQKGNTYMALRDIVPDASNDFGTINQFQYYGLATPFQDVALTARIDYNGFEPVQVSLIGEFIQNVAFNKGAINDVAVNNRGPVDDSLSNSIGSFDGSPTAWFLQLRIGTPALSKRWDWNVDFGYRYIGSDSVVDGFNDSDFGLGGTNMQGFTVGGSLALSSNVWMSLHWYGSDNIAGPAYKLNIIQFDLNAKF